MRNICRQPQNGNMPSLTKRNQRGSKPHTPQGTDTGTGQPMHWPVVRPRLSPSFLCPQAVSATLAPHLNEPGLPSAVKFSFKSGEDLTPGTVCSPGAPLKRYTFTMRVPASAGACASLPTLCGGASCMTALADKVYDNCPTYTLSSACTAPQHQGMRVFRTRDGGGGPLADEEECSTCPAYLRACPYDCAQAMGPRTYVMPGRCTTPCECSIHAEVPGCLWNQLGACMFPCRLCCGHGFTTIASGALAATST